MADSVATIHERMLGNIDDEFDKNKGEFVYDLTMPTAIETARLDEKSDYMLDQGFVDTATGDNLDRKCAEKNVIRRQATYASGVVTIAGVAGAAITAGELVASDTVSFAFTRDASLPASGQIDIEVICQTAGAAGNVPAGAIKSFPKTLEGLRTVANAKPFINGYDQESDDSLRERYYIKARTPATSGNKWHYLGWAKEVTGVGDARVFPLDNGPGTVTVIIIDANMRGADDALIASTLAHIEEVRPIGAAVTVRSAEELPVNVSLTLQIDSENYTMETVHENIKNSLIEYLKDIAFQETYVSYAKIGNTVLNCAGVLDYNNLTLNGGTANIPIEDTQVAVLGGVIFG